MRDVLKQLLTYNDNANCRFIETIRAAEPSSERIITIFSHILNAHRIWNTRIGGVSPTSGVWELHSVERWSDLNCENFDRSKEIIESEAPDRMVEYRDTKGNPYRNTVRDILIHVVNHSSYHRGQLAILLGQEEKTPPVTDYIAYLRDAD